MLFYVGIARQPLLPLSYVVWQPEGRRKAGIKIDKKIGKRMVTGETGLKSSEGSWSHRHTNPAGWNVNKPQRKDASGCEPRKQ